MTEQELTDDLAYGAETARAVLSAIWEKHPDWIDPVVTMLMDWIDIHLPDEASDLIGRTAAR